MSLSTEQLPQGLRRWEGDIETEDELSFQSEARHIIPRQHLGIVEGGASYNDLAHTAFF